MGVYYLLLPEEIIIKDNSGRRIALHSNGTWHAFRLISPLKRAPEHEPQTEQEFTPMEDSMTQEHFDNFYTMVHEYGRKHSAGESINGLKGKIEAEISRLAGITGMTNHAGLQGRMHPEKGYVHAA